MQKIKILRREDIGDTMIVNGKPAAVVRSRYNEAVLATKKEQGIVELLCWEGGERHPLVLQRIGEAGKKFYEYSGPCVYVYSSAEHGDFDHYNSQFARHLGFIPYT